MGNEEYKRKTLARARWKAMEKHILEKSNLLREKGGMCVFCEYGRGDKDCWAAISFHHTSEKTANPSYLFLLRDRSEKQERELEETIPVCRNCHNSRVHFPHNAKDKNRRERYLYLLERGGGHCAKCKIKIEFTSCFDLHHPPGLKKTGTPAYLISKFNKDPRIKKELEACLVLCPNCHQEIHNPLLNRKEIENYLKVIRKEIKENSTQRKERYQCPRK